MSTSDSESEQRPSRKGRRPAAFVSKKKAVKQSRHRKARSYSDSEDSEADILVKDHSEYSGTDDENRYYGKHRNEMNVPDNSDSDLDGGRIANKKKEQDPDENAVASGAEFKLPTDPSIMIFVGSCAAGKSYMLRYCMYHWARMKHFGFGLAYCPTSFNGDMSWLPERAVKAEYDEAHLEGYITNLRKKTEEGKKKHGNAWELKPNFILFDDCLSLLIGSKFFNNWVSTFRHTNTYPIILTQYMAASRSVSTLLRNCTNIAFMWPQSLKNSLQSMHAAYGQLFDSYDEFCAELNKCRERKFSCLVYRNSPDYIDKRAYCRIRAGEFPQNFSVQF